MGKLFLSGNEAIAKGAYDSGIRVGVGYPGTPSTEILEAFVKNPDVYTEWSINEKTALEVGIGASLAGARALVTMKHVGVNVAADPLFTLSYTGVVGGLIVVSADDPGMHSSQNEQDNRHYGESAKIPVLEPADSQEAYDFIDFGLNLSEKYDTPVLFRITTRIAHTRCIVVPSQKKYERKVFKFNRNLSKYVMIPANARKRHIIVEERIKRLENDSNDFFINRMEVLDKKKGFITSGIVYNYIKDIFPDSSILKLGMSYPIPYKLIKKFAEEVEELYVVEELDPFLETHIKAAGIKVKGKEYFPLTGELLPDVIKKSLNIRESEKLYLEDKDKSSVLPRPPALCPGCPHRATFLTLKKLKLKVSGDIGCYTLGVLPPYNSMDTTIAMGASVGVFQGIAIGEGDKFENDVVAVIGDSTFAHSGITGLINAAYNKRKGLIIVLDNSITAMTGMQPNPLSGERITGEETISIDYKKLGESIGINSENIQIVDAFNIKEIEDTIKKLLKSNKLSLLIVKGNCAINAAKRKILNKKADVIVDYQKCVNCDLCLKTGCPAISKDDNKILINNHWCTGCEVCMQVCPTGAIVYEE